MRCLDVEKVFVVALSLVIFSIFKIHGLCHLRGNCTTKKNYHGKILTFFVWQNRGRFRLLQKRKISFWSKNSKIWFWTFFEKNFFCVGRGNRFLGLDLEIVSVVEIDSEASTSKSPKSWKSTLRPRPQNRLSRGKWWKSINFPPSGHLKNHQNREIVNLRIELSVHSVQ